jgi:23S rRNA (cytidine1920-2'-O)/16S rRNA (cytidine1409-2'-O)-methyltransferase
VRRGLAASRAQAQRFVADGLVTVGGAPAGKPSSQVTPGEAIAVRRRGAGYASRGGHKLAGALDVLGVDPRGRSCLDAGASTGGFTDVLLRAGAASVVAVDVGYGQLDWRLRSDDRVVVLDRTNVRHLRAGDVPPPRPQFVVADLSFISLTLVLPALRAVADDQADFVLLVKPQFEVGRDRVARGGVVRDPSAWEAALRRVADSGRSLGLTLAGACVSPLPGPAGNIEFFLWLRAGPAAGAGAAGAAALTAAVDDGRRLAGG